MMSSVQPLQQSTLINSFQAMPSSSKKRSFTLINGVEVDLKSVNSKGPVSPEVIEAMKARIIELEDELAAQPPPAKRARKSAASTSVPEDEASSSQAGPSNATTTASTKADEKKKKMQFKKMFDRLKKECKSDTCKFQGSPKTIKFDEVMEVAEFTTMFGGKGTLIQPTPTNKPSSTVTIIDFNKAQVADLFGAELKALKGNRWSKGGVPTRTGGGFGGFGFGSSTFSKSVKTGSCDVEIRSLNVNYSKNGMKCTMKFDVGQAGGGGMYGYGYDSDDY